MTASPDRVRRSQRGDVALAAPGRPATSRGVVVLHPHAVAAGDHHGRVRRPRLGARLDDDPCLGPRLEALVGRRRRLPGLGESLRIGAGQRRHPDRDAAVPGEGLMHEVEAVGHRLAARPDRNRGQALLAGEHRAVRPVLAAHAAVGGQEHADEHDKHPGDDHADDPAADAAELYPLRPQQLAKAGPAHARRGAAPRQGAAGRCSCSHCATSWVGSARNSTASLVMSM